MRDDRWVKKFIKAAIRIMGYDGFEQLVGLSVKEIYAAGEGPKIPSRYAPYEVGLVDIAERRLDYETEDSNLIIVESLTLMTSKNGDIMSLWSNMIRAVRHAPVPAAFIHII